MWRRKAQGKSLIGPSRQLQPCEDSGSHSCRRSRSGQEEVMISEACVCAKSLQLCSTLRNPRDCSPPGSSVLGIFQVMILEWVAMPSSRGSFSTQGSSPCLLCLLHWRAGSLPLAPSGKSDSAESWAPEQKGYGFEVWSSGFRSPVCL